MKMRTLMKLFFAFLPVGVLVSIPYILQIKKMLDFPNPDMYE